VLADLLLAQGHPVLQVGDHEQHVGTGGGDLGHHLGRVVAAWVVGDVGHRLELPVGQLGPRAVGHRRAVDVVDGGDGEAQRGRRPPQLRGQPVGDEADGPPAQQAAGRGDPEHQVTLARPGQLADGPGLPEQRPVPGGGGGGRARDGAAVAAEDQVHAPVGQRPDGPGGGVGLGHVDLLDLHRPAADAALGVDQVGRDPDPVVLVDPAHALGAAQRVDGPDPHRLGLIAGAGGHEQQGEEDDEEARMAHGLRSPPGGWQQRA
jgi:hypothetical protein